MKENQNQEPDNLVPATSATQPQLDGKRTQDPSLLSQQAQGLMDEKARVRGEKKTAVPQVHHQKEKTRGLKKKNEKHNAPSVKGAARPTTTIARERGLEGTKFQQTTVPAAEPGIQFYSNPDQEIEEFKGEEQEPDSILANHEEEPSIKVQEEIRHSQDAIPVQARLVTEDSEIDKEQLRKEAERDVEAKLLANMVQAEVVTTNPEDGKNQGHGNGGSCSRNRNIILAVALVLIVAIVAAAAVTVTKNQDEKNELTAFPTRVPTNAPSPSPTNLPSAAPSESFTNDVCLGAAVLSDAEIMIRGTTDLATLKDDVATCGQDVIRNGRGRWYHVTGQDALIRANTCNSSTFDTQLSIYSGDCDEAMDCVVGNDQWCGKQSSVYWYGEAGKNYSLMVHTFRGTGGEFSLEVQHELHRECESSIDFQATMSGDGQLPEFDCDEATFGSTRGGSPLRDCNGATNIGTPAVWYKHTDTGGSIGYSVVSKTEESVIPQNDSYIVVYGDKSGVEAGDFVLERVFGWACSKYYDRGDSNFVCEYDLIVADYTLPANGTALFGSTLESQSGPLSGSCGDSVFGTSQAAWYAARGTGRKMTVSTCNNYTKEEDFDTQISVFSGTCDTLQCIDGNDQACGDQSSVSWFSTKDEIYLIAVYGYSDRKGAFQIGLEADAEEEHSTDQQGQYGCSDAIDIVPDGASILGTTTNISDYSNYPSSLCDFRGSSPGVFYRATGNGKIWTASTCSSATNFAARVSVYSGSADSCSDYKCEAIGGTFCGSQNAMTWTTVKSQSYLILVHGFDECSWGDFVLTLEEQAPNDKCDRASVALSLDGPATFGSTRSSTFDENAPECDSEAGDTRNPLGRGLWYKVVGRANESILASICSDGKSYTNFNARLTVYTGDCGSLKCVFVGSQQQEDCSLQDVAWVSQEGEVYYILVHGEGDEFGNFQLSLATRDTAFIATISPSPTMSALPSMAPSVSMSPTISSFPTPGPPNMFVIQSQLEFGINWGWGFQQPTEEDSNTLMLLISTFYTEVLREAYSNLDYVEAYVVGDVLLADNNFSIIVLFDALVFFEDDTPILWTELIALVEEADYEYFLSSFILGSGTVFASADWVQFSSFQGI